MKAKDKAPKFKPPKKIGECADLLYTLRAKRLKIQKQADDVKTQETILTEHIINTLPATAQSGVAGKLARVSIQKEDVPKVDDWDKFYAYIAKNKAFELLGRRLKTEAINERLDKEKKIPGIGSITVKSVSINKV